MSYIADRLRALAAEGRSAGSSPVVNHESGFGPPVKDSEDFGRVSALPRRELKIYQQQIDALHAEILRPEATRRLRPIQALALLEARAQDGLFGPIGVGAGKTDVSLLLPTVMKSKVAVLLVPAALRTKVIKHDYPQLMREYHLPHLVGGDVVPMDRESVLYVFSYSELSLAKNSDLLERLRPDLIVCDEAHALRHPTAARTKRFVRYFKANRTTRLAALSGTITSKSLKDYAHLAFLALKDGTFTPTKWVTLEEWAAALDVGPMPTRPGVLRKWCRDDEPTREGWRRRMVETPGVVATTESAFLGASLNFYERKVEVPKDLKAALRDLAATWTRPDGEETFEDPMAYARCARQLATGFYYRWKWPRGEAETVRRHWLSTRSDFHRAMARFLQYRAKPGLDSPLLVTKAVQDGRVDMPEYWAWSAVKDLCEPETEAVWLSRAVLENAAAWLEENKGIAWYEHVEIGKELAAMTGLRHYGEAKQDRSLVGRATPHFDEGWKRITLAAPLPNTSSETRGELREIRRQAKSVTPEQRAIIELQDRDDLEMEFVGLLRRMGQPVHKPLVDEIKAIAEELTTIGLYFKDRFDRARPAQLFRAMGLEPFPEGETTGTASYPSNHALIGTFLGEWLADKFPAKATALRRLGKQMGDLRVAGGWHFPSDVEAGRKLAQKLKSFFEEQA